ncbi:MAG: glutathione S-transferase family protein [Propylenella sp.]
MADLKIIGIPQSTYVRVVRMAAEEKGVPYDLDPQPPHSDPVKAVHPFGKVPVMRHGDLELCESRAIAAYIDRAFDGPPLMPRDPTAAARAEQWISMVNTIMDQSLIRKYFLAGYVFPRRQKRDPDADVIGAVLPDVERQLGVIEAALAKSAYLSGDGFSLADINLMPILFYLKGTPEAGARIDNSGPLTEYYERNSRRPSFANTVPPT